MKIFLSHRFTGENLDELKTHLEKISNALKVKNLDVFCSIYKCGYFTKQNYSTDEIYEYCNNELIKNDIILFFIKSTEPSHGMQMELDIAIKHKKKIILLIHKDLEFNNFRNSAHDVIEYEDLGSINEHVLSLEI